jgi:hypothetical protein
LFAVFEGAFRLPAIIPPKTKVVSGRGRGFFARANSRDVSFASQHDTSFLLAHGRGLICEARFTRATVFRRGYFLLRALGVVNSVGIV